MNTKFDTLLTFKFVYYFWKKIYIAPLMPALLLATIIIFKTDIRPEAGCHLYYNKNARLPMNANVELRSRYPSRAHKVNRELRVIA